MILFNLCLGNLLFPHRAILLRMPHSGTLETAVVLRIQDRVNIPTLVRLAAAVLSAPKFARH